MKLNICLLFNFCFICCILAESKLTVKDVVLPTKLIKKYVDMYVYYKLGVNNTNNLYLRFELNAEGAVKNNTAKFYFNDALIDFTSRHDVQRGVAVNETFTLVFSKYSESIVGQYTMTIDTQDNSKINATGHIVAPPFLEEFPVSIGKIEGGRMSATCKSQISHPNINLLYWEMAPKANFRVAESRNDTKFNDIIIWDLLVVGDSGNYRCIAKNDIGNDTVVLKLRVKGKLAPLWPFLGILIEIAVLVVIIVVHEYRKGKKKTEVIQDNPQRQSLLKSVTEEEEVRQRNIVC